MYNSADTSVEVQEIKARLQGLISMDSMVQVDRITGQVAKEAAALMKTGKADVSGGYSSDAILNGLIS